MSTMFFRAFWMIFVALMGLHGLSLAIVAGSSFSAGEWVIGVVAAMLAVLCAMLCGAADDCRRALAAHR